jgi:hypothetical protein
MLAGIENSVLREAGTHAVSGTGVPLTTLGYMHVLLNGYIQAHLILYGTQSLITKHQMDHKGKKAGLTR